MAISQATPMTLSERDLDELRGINERVSLNEVAQIYLPLSRLLNLYVAATQNLRQTTDTFLGKLASPIPYVIGIAGSVAVGKSTAARIIQALLSRWPNHPKVDLITTDGFLFPNRILEEKGLMGRKGFPEEIVARDPQEGRSPHVRLQDPAVEVGDQVGRRSEVEELRVPFLGDNRLELRRGELLVLPPELLLGDLYLLDGLAELGHGILEDLALGCGPSGGAAPHLVHFGLLIRPALGRARRPTLRGRRTGLAERLEAHLAQRRLAAHYADLI